MSKKHAVPRHPILGSVCTLGNYFKKHEAATNNIYAPNMNAICSTEHQNRKY